jgi:hypothetical protein
VGADLSRANPVRPAPDAISLVKRHIARVNVGHEHAVTLERVQDRFDFWPAVPELVLLLCAPIGEDFVD